MCNVPSQGVTITHVAHPQHSLALIHRPSSFKCDACNVEENIRDMSCKCKTCPFWIHKSCADAPNLLYLFQSLHEHPLVLFYGRPQSYHKYYQWCRLCNENISQLSWFYKCRDGCIFFTHILCARSRYCPDNFFFSFSFMVLSDLVKTIDFILSILY